MSREAMQRWVTTHLRLITYIASSFFVGLWTIIRHISNGVNFDVVGQIGLADQWARGLHNGAQLGATNYLLKMPVYYLVNQLGFLSPHAKLLLLALVCNIATFVLLLVLFERLLRLYDSKPRLGLYLTIVWLASISGRVYWLDYANSRNLETVGGVLLLYLVLRLIKQTTIRRALWVLGVGAVVFFADPLQMYTVGGGMVLYALLLAVRNRTKQQAQQTGIVWASLAGAYLVAKVLQWLIIKLLPVTFLVAPHANGSLSLGTIEPIIKGLGASTARIFDVSFYANNSLPNVVRELLNLGILVSLLVVVFLAWRSMRRRDLAVACLCCIATCYAAYIASYQVLQPLTERYIAMVPILFGLLAGSVITNAPFKRFRLGYAVWVGALLVSGVFAVGALAVSWPARYAKDTYLPATIDFLQTNNYSVAVSSRNGIPLTYFSNHSVAVLPAICLPNHTLVASNLFYDRADFAKLRLYQGDVPLLLPGNVIESSGSICTVRDVERQFGSPKRQLAIPGFGSAEIYDATQLRLSEQ